MFQKSEFWSSVLLALIVSFAGCNDQRSSGGWGFDTDSPSSDAAVSTDAGGDDQPKLDTHESQPADSNESDGSSADTRIPVDTGPGWTEQEGWYVQGFEQSEFIPDDGPYPRGIFDNGECSIRLQDVYQEREKWWAAWTPRPEPETMSAYPPGAEPRSDVPGFYRTRGKLSPKGSYGHLGGYDRKFEVVEAELDRCQSVAELGHCTTPKPGSDPCVITDRTPADDRNAPFEKDVFARLDTTDGGLVYVLQLHQPRTDHGSRIEIEFPVAPTEGSHEGGIPLEESAENSNFDPRFSMETTTLGGTHRYGYDNVTGWVGPVPGFDADVWYVSISGTDLRVDDPEIHEQFDVPDRLHVWGVYMAGEDGASGG